MPFDAGREAVVTARPEMGSPRPPALPGDRLLGAICECKYDARAPSSGLAVTRLPRQVHLTTLSIPVINPARSPHLGKKANLVVKEARSARLAAKDVHRIQAKIRFDC